MKIIKLMGGLGNQMFQYAFGKVIGANGYDVQWFDEVKKSSGGTQRGYELDFFNCHPTLFSKEETKHYLKRKYLFFFKKKLPFISENPTNVYNPELMKVSEGFFEGYFQCAKYCEGIRNELLKDFVPKEKPDDENRKLLEKITSTNSVSLHVRRGDYVQLQHIHGLCDLDYYQKAIDFIASKIHNPHFFLFSDDIPWVEANLKINFPYTIVNINHGKDSAWDMWLMKNCQHNIVANSSFSWWGAWLNENPEKIVIAPKVWFSDGQKTDIVPENWQRI